MSELIAAAERHAEAYADDDRQDIKTDVLNAFYAGAKFAGEHIAELERELANLTATLNAERGLAGSCGLASRTLIVKYKTELAATQATAEKLREVLHVVKYAHDNGYPYNFDCELYQSALALPNDRSCLDAMLADARKEGMLKAAGICDIESDGYGGIVEGPIASERGKQVYQAMAAGAANCADAIRQAAGGE